MVLTCTPSLLTLFLQVIKNRLFVTASLAKRMRVLETICSTGRTLSELEHQGTGTGLFIQNGTNPLEDVIEIPQREMDLAKTKWTRGSCFKTMGK